MMHLIEKLEKRNRKDESMTIADSLPRIDADQIIRLVLEVYQKKKTPQQAAMEAGMPFVTWAKVYTKDKAQELINQGIGKIGLESLAKTDFSQRLVSESVNIVKLIHQYGNGQIDEEQLVSCLGGTELKNLCMEVAQALGLPEKLGVADMNEVLNLAPSTLAYTAFMAAYRILRKAQDELELARAERIRIETACQASIARIVECRREMDRIVSKYLSDRLEAFEAGFAAMDQAMLEGDGDRYIRGNAEIQNILRYDVQFTTQDEFDALMESEEAFKL